MDFAGNASLTRSAALSGDLVAATIKRIAKFMDGVSNFNLLTARFLELNIHRRIEAYFYFCHSRARGQGIQGRADTQVRPYGEKPGFPFSRE